MEIVAAASSVAGILSLINQSIAGASKLNNIFSDASRASCTISRFLSDIDSLLQALYFAKDLLEKLPIDFCGSQVTSLRIELQYCTKDVHRLLDIASSLRPVSGTGTKAWFQRFWVAVNKNHLIDAREELERHKQAINLSIAVLGRTMDIHIAASVERLDKKVEQGTTASLSMIEEQNTILERIEAHTETSLVRSAASDRSLHSIATSLSRIEALASSVASATMSQKAEHGESLKSKVRTKRRSTGEITRTRRRSGGSALSGRASATSLHSLPAVPSIPEKHLSTVEPARLSEVTEASTRWNDSCKETQTPWTSIYTDPQHMSLETPICAGTNDKTPARAETVDISLHQQHRLFHQIIQEAVALTYPPNVVEYISLMQAIRDYESKISLLNLLNFGSNLEESSAFRNQSALCETDIYILARERDVLQDRLWALLDDLQDCRRRCVFEGHSLHDIDERFGIRRLDNCANNSGNEVLFQEVQKEGSKLLSCWSSNRDRINRWLLDCLKSDEQQAKLHRSMLADPPLDEEYWTRQVLRHWYIDEAAVGEELPLPRSVGAVDSHTLDSPNAGAEDDDILGTKFQDEEGVAAPQEAANEAFLVGSGVF